MVQAPSACRKSSPLAIFSDKTGFHCTFGAAMKTCKETLLRKASDLTAHVAEVGLAVGGLRPSDTSHGFIDSLKEPARMVQAPCFCLSSIILLGVRRFKLLFSGYLFNRPKPPPMPPPAIR